MIDWTPVMVASVPALWLWTLLAGRIPGRFRAAPPPERAEQAQRQQAQRCAAPEILPVFPVEGRGIPLRVGRRRVSLRSACATSALAVPAQREAIAPKAEPVTEQLTAQHRDRI